MEDRLLVTASPHIRDHSTTRGLMGNVVTLLPAVLASALIFGARAYRRRSSPPSPVWHLSTFMSVCSTKPIR